MAKAEGQEIAVAEAAPEATNVIDLMKVLEGSVQAARTGRGGATAPQRPLPRAIPSSDQDDVVQVPQVVLSPQVRSGRLAFC